MWYFPHIEGALLRQVRVTQSLTSVAACAAPTNEKLTWTVYNMALIYLRNYIDKRGRWCENASAALCAVWLDGEGNQSNVLSGLLAQKLLQFGNLC